MAAAVNTDFQPFYAEKPATRWIPDGEAGIFRLLIMNGLTDFMGRQLMCVLVNRFLCVSVAALSGTIPGPGRTGRPASPGIHIRREPAGVSATLPQKAVLSMRGVTIRRKCTQLAQKAWDEDRQNRYTGVSPVESTERVGGQFR